MKIERDKWYVMRNGEKVRVVCVDAPGECPVIAVDDEGCTYVYQGDGRFLSDGKHITDLISEHREPARWWANIYGNGDFAGPFRSKEQALGAAAVCRVLPDKIAVEFVEVVNGRDDG